MGFRSMASTLLNEQQCWHPDAIERQLAHAPRNKVRAAYNYAEHLPERRRMMQAWADHLMSCEMPLETAKRKEDRTDRWPHRGRHLRQAKRLRTGSFPLTSCDRTRRIEIAADSEPKVVAFVGARISASSHITAHRQLHRSSMAHIDRRAPRPATVCKPDMDPSRRLCRTD